MKTFLTWLLLCAAALSSANAAEFDDALVAYQAGDYPRAARTLQVASDRGDARAQAALGLMFEQGKGVVRDPARALALFRKAAAQGHRVAQYSLGVAYTHGQGVAKDLAQARSWYERAAAQGLAGAQLNLGALYYNGEGVARDLVEADKWFTIAAGNGLPDAVKAVASAESVMTPDQVRQAQEKAAEWAKAHP
jgi:TPR repeat protein